VLFIELICKLLNLLNGGHHFDRALESYPVLGRE
jgi:hypothetical protein